MQSLVDLTQSVIKQTVKERIIEKTLLGILSWERVLKQDTIAEELIVHVDPNHKINKLTIMQGDEILSQLEM